LVGSIKIPTSQLFGVRAAEQLLNLRVTRILLEIYGSVRSRPTDVSTIEKSM
jgi:hypothetical protein